MLLLIEKYKITVLTYNNDAVKLANIYVNEQIINKKFYFVALHIAFTSVHLIDYILTFNYNYMVKLKQKKRKDR
jgi:hypothetical protein